MIVQDDVKLILDARQLIDRAKREGSPYLFAPVTMLEQLVERATRPHD